MKLDPFVSNDPVDTSRFTYAKQIEFYSQDKPTDLVRGVSIQLANAVVNGTQRDNTQEFDGQVLAGGELDFIGKLGVKAGTLYRYTYHKLAEITAGTSNFATFKMQTSTACMHTTLDVYYDSMFGSFYVSPSRTSTCADAPADTGFATYADGRPAANEVLRAILSDGREHVVVTDPNGRYRRYDDIGSTTLVGANGVRVQSDRLVIPLQPPPSLNFSKIFGH